MLSVCLREGPEDQDPRVGGRRGGGRPGAPVFSQADGEIREQTAKGICNLPSESPFVL